MATETERLTYTPVEAGKLLGLSTRAVQEACQAGTLPAARVGRAWLLPAWGLQRWLAEQSHCPIGDAQITPVSSDQEERLAKLRELRALVAQVNQLAVELEA